MKIVVDRRFSGGSSSPQLHMSRHDDDLGVVISDTFRVVNGKIVEHWDIHQDVPADKVNPLTMW